MSKRVAISLGKIAASLVLAICLSVIASVIGWKLVISTLVGCIAVAAYALLAIEQRR